MAPVTPRGKPNRAPTERRIVGMTSLVIGLVLFVLIMLRGQQASQQGNTELRDDVYVMLISPLVFAGFGVFLLRHPDPASGNRRRTAMPQPATASDNRAAAKTTQPIAQPTVVDRRSAVPSVRGLTVYSTADVNRLLASCDSSSGPPAKWLQRCAALLSARLVDDGYINSRVSIQETPAPGSLEVVEGRIVEVRIACDDPQLEQQARDQLGAIQGKILHLPSVEAQLQQLKRLPGLTDVQSTLSSLGRDPTQGVFSVSLQTAVSPGGAGEIATTQLAPHVQELPMEPFNADQPEAFISEARATLERKLAQTEDDLRLAHEAAQAAEQRMHQLASQADARITSLEQQLKKQREAGLDADRARQVLVEAAALTERRLAETQEDLAETQAAVEALEEQSRAASERADAHISGLQEQLQQKQEELATLQRKLNQLVDAARADARAAGEQAMALHHRLDTLRGSLEEVVPEAESTNGVGASHP
mgnify:CR=1 FL=1